MEFIRRILGGRPMRRDGFAFTDVVSGKSVCYYLDTLGRRWLSTSPWARFRVEASK